MSRFLFYCMFFLSVQLAAAQTYDDIEKLIDKRKFADAEKILKEKLTANADDDTAHFHLGKIPVIAREKKNYDEAIVHLEKCVALKPANWEYHLWLGNAYGVKAQDAGIFGAMGYVGKVKDSYLKAVELNPKNFEARSNLNQFYLQAPGIVGGGYDKARDNAVNYAKYNSTASKVLLAQVAMYEKKYDEAETELISAGKQSSNLLRDAHISAFKRLGDTYYTEKSFVKLEKISEQFLSIYPDNVLVHRYLFNAFREEKSFAKLEKFATQFLSIRPDEAEAYNWLGIALFEQQKLDAAMTNFEKALSLDRNFGSQYRIGRIYQERGDKEKAIKFYEEFLTLKTTSEKTKEDAKRRLDELKRN